MADDDDDEDCRKRRTTITPTKNEITSFKIWDSAAAETEASSVIAVYEVLGAAAGTTDSRQLQFWSSSGKSSPLAIWT